MTRSSPPQVLSLLDDDCGDRAVVGGKAAGLARLAAADLPVPPGFAVTTHAYADHLVTTGLGAMLGRAAAGLDTGDPVALEEQTVRIRDEIESRELSDALSRQILDAYHALGDDCYVAVRSSAIAEDMAEASFAGLHDTFLDVRGDADVLDAVRRCWASLWTARCVAYRRRIGVPHSDALIAVVVQQMVPAEVAGVLFTANPLTARTDEYVVNASFGLGEGVVSGILTPDEFVIDPRGPAVRYRTLGAKEREVVRSRSGRGTEIGEVPAKRREQWSLTDRQLADLTLLGTRAMDFHGGLPQDIEWAFAGGRCFLLQSRAVTGVDFTWDEDIDAWQNGADSDKITWTHAWAAAYWTGGISPLFYSIRARELTEAPDNPRFWSLYGFDDLKGQQYFRYRRATAYYNADVHAKATTYIFPRFVRAGALEWVPPAWREQVMATRYSLWRGAKMWARVKFRGHRTRGPFQWFDASYKLMNDRAYAAGPTDDQLRAMSDAGLKISTLEAIRRTARFIQTDSIGFSLYSPLAFEALRRMLTAWYDGDVSFAVQDLTSGVPQRTAQVDETLDFWQVVTALKESEELLRLLDETDSGQFFAECRGSDAGKRFLDVYQPFLEKWGHRGAADRDIFYPRRSEDPAIDAQALRLLARAVDAVSPTENEHRLVARREEATTQILGAIRRRRCGRAKAWLVGRVQHWILRFFVLRDDERDMMDRLSMTKKRHVEEVGRRLCDRGVLTARDEVYFLAETEMWDLLAGAPVTPLTRAKLAGRRKAFEEFNTRRTAPAEFLRGGRPVDLGLDTDAGTDRFTGTALSRGTFTGRARVVPNLSGIGRLERGDVLICNATDPGWSPVFALIGALVMETGGALAHGACLSREYGLPAVTVPRALQRIPDGATVRVDGTSGEVTIVEDAAPAHGSPE